MSGYLMGQDDAAGSRSGYQLDLLPGKVAGNQAAELLGVVRVLENAKFLPVDGGMMARSEQEMPLKYGP